MLVLCTSLCFLSTAMPPLTEAQRVALATAIDDRDYQESAFAALAEAALALDVASLDANSLTSADSIQWDQVLDDPDSMRGEPVLLSGRLEQSQPLSRPWDAFTEWFVRAPDGRAFAVYVPLEDDRESGESVRVPARFYKRIQATARDETVRRYPALVGRPLALHPVEMGGAWIVILVIAFLCCWVLLRVLVRSPGAPARMRTAAHAPFPAENDEKLSEDLPTDAAEALDVLARRSEDSSAGGGS